MKKVIATVFALIMLIALAACSGNSTQNESTSNSGQPIDLAVMQSASGFAVTDEEARKLYDLQLAEHLRTAILTSHKIQDAMIVVNTGEKSLEDDSPNGSDSSVSVLLVLEDGETLTSQEVQAIADYIRGGVPGIKYEDITITDSNLNLYPIGGGNEDIEPRNPLPYSVGTVKAVSNQTEYRPLVNWIYALAGGIAADGAGMFFEDGELKDTLGNATGVLPYIPYSDDFRITIDGESAGKPSYTLYSNEGELLYDSDSFLPPDNVGEYFLLVTLTWSNNDTDKYLEYSGFQYWFSIIIG